MRRNHEDAHVRERREAHGAERVAVEVEERRAEGEDRTVRDHAIADGHHGVFADAEAEVAAVARGLLEVGDALERRHV